MLKRSLVSKKWRLHKLAAAANYCIDEIWHRVRLRRGSKRHWKHCSVVALHFCCSLHRKAKLLTTCFFSKLYRNTSHAFPRQSTRPYKGLWCFRHLSSCIRKGSARWKSNAPRLIRSVPSSNLLQICNTESSCNRSKYEKEDDEFVKTKL